MEVLGDRFSSFVHSVVRQSGTGHYVLDERALSMVWSRLSDQARVPDWKRFSEFVSSTAHLFECHPCEAQNMGVSLASNGSKRDFRKEYFAEVLVVMFYDLLGITISPEAFRAFLQDHRQTYSSESNTDASSSNCVPNSSIDGCYSNTATTDDEKEGSFGPTSNTSCRPQSVRLRKAIYSKLSEQSDCKGAAEMEQDRDLSDQPADGGDEIDVPMLLAMLKEKDDTIQKLRLEKKRLQQNMRRTNERLLKQQKTHISELTALRNRKDFDIQRRDENWENASKKWSWLTSKGYVNLAAS